MISVIVATLMRPSLQDLLNSLRTQTLPRDQWELLTWSGGINEYDARNQAAKEAKGEILAFTDDDCVAHPNWLESAMRHFQDPRVMLLTGPLEGDMWGHGKSFRLSMPGWYVGANLFIRKSAFIELGGFESTWGLNPPPRGWRGDSDLGFRCEDRFGRASCLHAEDVLIYHPGAMGSAWQPQVEQLFYLRHRAKCLARFAPYDPRMCQFVTQYGIEKDDRIRRRLTHDQKPRLDWMLLNAQGPILDVGCGEGLTFAGTDMDVTLLDLDLYNLPDFLRGDALQLPFKAHAFKTVCLGEILEHVPDPMKLLKEAARVSAHQILITTPNEHEWDPGKAPLLTREERMKVDGKASIQQMQRDFTGTSPYCKDMIDDEWVPHSWHVRWYTEETLKKDLQALPGCRYEISKTRFSGFAFFLVKLFR